MKKDHESQPEGGAGDVSQPVSAGTAQQGRLPDLMDSVRRRAPLDAARLLQQADDREATQVLEALDPSQALKIISYLPADRQRALDDATRRLAERWSLNRQFGDYTVGRIMSEPAGVFYYDQSVATTIEKIRQLVKDHLFTYVYVLDDQEKLCGVVVMRDLMLANPDQLLSEIMLREPFYFTPETSIDDAMQAVVRRHYPVYPVCDQEARLIGLVPGYMLFEEHSFELTSHAGRMVGVEHGEHISTPWTTCLKFRHPWLQLNLLTAFLAALVVGLFEETIQQVVVLAAFLPVLAGQSGNTGCQSLAVTLRGLTLGEFGNREIPLLLRKEALLGCVNGLLVGVVAALGMYGYAHFSGSEASLLALVVLIAMVGSCVMSGMTGVLVPMALRRLGADPVTASSIFVTTVTDVCSMGALLLLATLVV